MKILVLNYEYPPIGGGGGAVCAQVAAELADRGHQVWVHTVHHGDLPKLEQHGNLQVQRSFGFRRQPDRCSVPEMAGYLVGGLLPALRLLKRTQAEVIHAHFAVPTGALAFALHLLTGVPYVITAHLGDVPGGVPEQTDRLFSLLKPLTRPIWRRAAARTAVSHFVQQLAEKAYAVPVNVIPNPVTVPAQQPQRDWPGPLRLIFVGRLSTQKNLTWLLKALQPLGGAAWQLSIVGDGPQRQALQQACEQFGLASQIRFLGWLQRDQVYAQLGQHHAFILPSLSEGMPVAVLEAMAHGLPVLASDIAPLRELVKSHENGFLFEHEEQESCRKAIRSLIENVPLRQQQGAASYQKASGFVLERIIDSYEKCLIDVGTSSAFT